MVGLIARYHRKSLPQDSHKYYSELDDRSKLKVRELAALLRFADGLDRAHQSSIEQVDCQVMGGSAYSEDQSRINTFLKISAQPMRNPTCLKKFLRGKSRSGKTQSLSVYQRNPA